MKKTRHRPLKRHRSIVDTVITVRHHFGTDTLHSVRILAASDTPSLFIEASQGILQLLRDCAQMQLDAPVEKTLKEDIPGLSWMEGRQHYRLTHKVNQKWTSKYYSVKTYGSKALARDAAVAASSEERP